MSIARPRGTGEAQEGERADIQGVLAIVRVAQERTARQIVSLELIVAAIVEGSELTSTDDEHDPEGRDDCVRASAGHRTTATSA